MRRKTLALLFALAFVATVWAANWALTKYGTVPVGFGLHAPAGVYFAGLAFILRDYTQKFGGRFLVITAIVAGSLLAYLIEASITIPGGVMPIAAASAIAFLFSELADFAVYTPLAERSFLGGVVASNIVGAVVDSMLFLWLAFGSLALIEGQIVGKLLVTAAALPLLLLSRRLVSEPA